jgi:TonB family protein
MGFNTDFESNKNKEVQLSLLDFQLRQADFAEGPRKSSSTNYRVHVPEQSKAPRFLTMSAMIHAAAFLTLAFATFPQAEEIKKEIITVEIEDQPHIRQLSQGEAVPATRGSLPEKVQEQKIVKEELQLPAAAPAAPVVATALPEKEMTSGKDEVVVAKKEAAKPVIQKAQAVKALPAKVAQKAMPAKANTSVAAKATMAAVPASLEDIQDPELDQGALATTAEHSKLNEDFNDDYENVNRTQAAALEKEKEQMENMATAVAAEQDESLKALNDQNAEEAEKLAAYNKSLKQKNAQAVASAVAAEEDAAQAAAAARAAAAQKAREEAAAKAAAVAAANAANSGTGKGDGAGAGNSGSSEASNAVAGAPTGVRSLDQLRQMPGNPRPQYSPEERLHGHMGKVGFLAYITKEGQPTQFRMIKSTGFQNLDSKTLTALKKWRFYPGQEGWVELPFQWDLKGETQEAGGLLRKKISSR